MQSITMEPIQLLNAIMLWIHLFSAVLFVGGSFFMWLVVVPATKMITENESERTEIVGKIAKRFGRITNHILIALILTGIYNAYWYLPNMSSLLSTYGGVLLLLKVILVIILLVFIYLHNVYFGRRIISLASENKIDELNNLRKRSRLVSAANLFLMVVILFVATLMQMPV
jgi:putative copper resistance protein D